MNKNDNKEQMIRMIMAIAISVLILGLWHIFYEIPRLEQQRLYEEKLKKDTSITLTEQNKKVDPLQERPLPEETLLPREDVISGRKNIVKIDAARVTGSISLQGTRFDDLVLRDYKQALKDDKKVALLSPANSAELYFAETGFLSADSNIALPDAHTIWSANKDTLRSNDSVVFTWNNGQGLVFTKEVSVDSDYMFSIKQSVHNNSDKEVSLSPYGVISRNFVSQEKPNPISHEGFTADLDSKLYEITLKKLKEQGTTSFDDSFGWFGISDKYWFSGFITNEPSDIRITSFTKDKTDRYQVDFVHKPIKLLKGGQISNDIKFFAGAKEAKLLDSYANKYNIHSFDKVVDFGWFYFLTKPIFSLMNVLHSLVGNFGVSIILLTLIIRLFVFPLAHKSYVAMDKMKTLHPRITEIKEKYGTDKQSFHKAVMELYKKEKVNPMAGCLPIIIQIPIFFSLYKVLFVTIEMRQANFIGWIKDLSVADPTSIFNLFGLLPYSVPTFLHIGVLPIIMGITMIIQQKLNPKPSDPTQAKVMQILPYFFTVLFASFPSGLVLYWSANNILSISQQWLITKYLHRKKSKK